MPAKFIPVGECAHDAEKQAIRFLVDGLPDTYTVYGNPWLVEQSGVIYELDAVVVAPLAVFVVETKAYRGRIDGTDHDWYIPHPAKSPLPLNRRTAQVLKTMLRTQSYQAGQVWTEGFIFLSATNDVHVHGPGSANRIHTRRTILNALQDTQLIQRITNGRANVPTAPVEGDILRLLTGQLHRGKRPVRHVREYDILETRELHDNSSDFVGQNRLSGQKRLLRVYSVPPLATPEQQRRVVERARWEAQVFARLGKSPHIVHADPPFEDESTLVLPFEFEPFETGISLPTWVSKFGPDQRGKERAPLLLRTNVWLQIAAAIEDAHAQGVVHRLLRPEVVLVEDRQDPSWVRVTGFDLAKQVSVETAISISSVGEDRLQFAAPEVVGSFSTAEPASDQFSLGALLAILLAGKPLFDSTRKMMDEGRLVRRVRDMAPRIPLSLDAAVTRMVERRPADRYPSLEQAILAVKHGRDPENRALPGVLFETRRPLDPDNLEEKTRIEPDYEILRRLGQGGLGVVYAARNIVSGETHALKISRADDQAKDLLQTEYQALAKLDHPNIVKVVFLSSMVEGRLTLIMKQVGTESLRQWLAARLAPGARADANAQRRLAEDLLAGLDYLEQRGVIHKDLKPDNLLVSDGRLTIIDFSLAASPEDAVCGTALYRDPAGARWTHGSDRYAAALCLFELYAGRHAFEGRVPQPGEGPVVAGADIDPPGLAAFFRKALHPSMEERFPSARAMRDGFLVALGEEIEEAPPVSVSSKVDGTTALPMTPLSRRAVRTLARTQVTTVSELLTLSAAQVRALHNIGNKTADEVIAFQDEMRARGIEPASRVAIEVDPPVVPDLVDSLDSLQLLAVSNRLRASLERAHLPTIGQVASLTLRQLRALDGVGRAQAAKVIEALHTFRSKSAGGTAHTLDDLWNRATRSVQPAHADALERVVGMREDRQTQMEIAEALGKSQPQISLDVSEALEKLDREVLTEARDALDSLLDGFGGLARLDQLGERFEQTWPGGVIRGEGMIRLLARISEGRAHVVETDGDELVAVPGFERDVVRAFAAEVRAIANRWPPVEPEAARRTLAALLPHFDGDPLALGARLCEGDVQIAETGHLFTPPLDAEHALGFLLEKARDPIELDALERKVREVFGAGANYPADKEHLVMVLDSLGCQVQGDRVVPGRTSSVVAKPALARDAVPVAAGRTEEDVRRDMLCDAKKSRGFRMLVVPPERHAEIARSVAKALDATWLSFEEAFFSDHAKDLAALERAERFAAQRDALTEAAEATFARLLEEHGSKDASVVVGDTAILGLCEALDLPRRLYDETLGGRLGFWVLVVPGVIHKNQPRFNEGPTMWHLPGATMDLQRPL